MATDKKELAVYKDGAKRPYFVKAENVNLGTKENPEFLPERLDSMAEDIADLEEQIGEGGYTPPAGGIPKGDLSDGVQESLGKADTAYQKPASGIPATDLADGVIPAKTSDLDNDSGYITIDDVPEGTVVNPATASPSMDGTAEVGVSAKYAREDHVHPHDTSKQDVINDIGAIRAGATKGATAVQPGDVPTRVSDLTNDLGYQTQQQVVSAISQAVIEAIVGSGDFAITYDDVNDIFDISLLIPAITIGDVAEFTAASKVKTVNIKGSNLKADIVLTVPTGWTASKTTLTQVNGAVDEDITLTYTGSESGSATGTLKATSGTLEVTKTLYYSQYGNQPTILVDQSTLSFEAIGGQSQTKTVAVSKFNLTNAITVQSSSNKFTASLNAAEDTLTVTYQPDAGDTGTQNATITLTSGTASAQVGVSGVVIVPSLSVSPASLAFSGRAGSTTAAQQLTITGTNLVNDVTVTIPTGFSAERNGSAAASPITLAKADVMASGGVTLDIKSSGDSSHASGSISVSSSGATTQNVPVEWVETEIETMGGSYFRKTGYSSLNGTTPNISIRFKIFKMNGVDGETTNEVRIVRADGGTGYQATNGYTNLVKVDIPSTITIGENIYDVTEIASGAFAYSDTLQLVNFLSPSKLKSVTAENNVGAFSASGNFKGTGVVNDINTFEFPASIRTIANSLGATAVKRVVVPNEFTGGLTALGGNGLWAEQFTHLDLGTGVTSLSHNNWGSATNLKDIIFRRTEGVVDIVDYAISNWSSTMSNGQLTIHVPSSLVETYKASTGNGHNWKALYDAGKVNFVAIDSK